MLMPLSKAWQFLQRYYEERYNEITRLPVERQDVVPPVFKRNSLTE